MIFIDNLKAALVKAREKYGSTWIGALAVGIVVVSLAAWWLAGLPHEPSLPVDLGGSDPNTANAPGNGQYDYREAPSHIGEKALITGTALRVFTAKSGVTFFDFCQGFDACPFSAVIFSSDSPKFGDLTRYEGREVRVTGIIRSYRGNAEMVLSDPSQITQE